MASVYCTSGAKLNRNILGLGSKICTFQQLSLQNNLLLSLGNAGIRFSSSSSSVSSSSPSSSDSQSLNNESPVEYPEMKPPKEREIYSIYHTTKKGMAYSKKPFKYDCKKGKRYYWCSCGHSKSQPFCDNTHKKQELRISLRPMPFVAEETRPYWFCNCKQTKNPPFCDGTHKTPDVQDGYSFIKY